METQGKKFFYIILGLSFIGLFLFLRSYIAVIIFSMLLATIFQPFYVKALTKFKNRRGLALAATFLLIILCFVLPLVLIGIIIAYSIRDISLGTDIANLSTKLSLNDIIDKINAISSDFGLNLNLTADALAGQIKDLSAAAGRFLFGNISNIASGILGIIPLLFIVSSVIGAILVNYHKISVYLHDLSPLDDKIDQLYVDRIKYMALSMVKGTFIIAVVQGLITGLTLWLVGVPYAFLLLLLAIFASVIPLGSGIITVPISIILIATGNVWQGILILAVQFLITSNIDNILRPKLVNKKASLHPALVLIGLFAGIANFGFMGLVYGPVIMIFFVTTIEVYREYYR